MTGLILDFLPALREPSLAIPDGLTDADGRPAGRRFNVYRNNVAVSLTEALETGFPAIHSLLGQENFRAIAQMHAAEHAPQGPLMISYGQEFPEFLAALPALSHIPYLGDVARLELALRDSYHAADHTPINPDALTSLPEDQIGATRLKLAPSLRLLQSPWPVTEIYTYAMDPTQPQPKSGAQDVAVLRQEFDPVAVPLPAGGHAFITALLQGEPLGNAAETAVNTSTDFDLGALMGLLLQHRAISGMETENHVDAA